MRAMMRIVIGRGVGRGIVMMRWRGDSEDESGEGEVDRMRE